MSEVDQIRRQVELLAEAIHRSVKLIAFFHTEDELSIEKRRYHLDKMTEWAREIKNTSEDALGNSFDEIIVRRDK